MNTETIRDVRSGDGKLKVELERRSASPFNEDPTYYRLMVYKRHHDGAEWKLFSQGEDLQISREEAIALQDTTYKQLREAE